MQALLAPDLAETLRAHGLSRQRAACPEAYVVCGAPGHDHSSIRSATFGDVIGNRDLLRWFQYDIGHFGELAGSDTQDDLAQRGYTEIRSHSIAPEHDRIAQAERFAEPKTREPSEG